MPTRSLRSGQVASTNNYFLSRGGQGSHTAGGTYFKEILIESVGPVPIPAEYQILGLTLTTSPVTADSGSSWKSAGSFLESLQILLAS